MKILSLSVISLLLFIAITDFKVGRWMGCYSPPFFINFILLSDLRCMYILVHVGYAHYLWKNSSFESH